MAGTLPDQAVDTNLVDDLITKYCPAGVGGWVPAVQASKIEAELRATPEGREALAAWLDRKFARILTAEITSRKPRNGRGVRMAQAVNRAFYMQHSCPGNVVKVASEMTADDHVYVADRHEMRAKTEGMLNAFHRAVSRRLKNGQVTSDVFSPDSYQKLHDSITA